jgi:hypothetical protein
MWMHTAQDIKEWIKITRENKVQLEEEEEKSNSIKTSVGCLRYISKWAALDCSRLKIRTYFTGEKECTNKKGHLHEYIKVSVAYTG